MPMIPPEQRAEIRRLYYAEHCDARAADLLFEVVSRRYERRSLVLTTNLPFSEWPSIFPNAATATALIDRVVHHAEIITIEGARATAAGGQGEAESPRQSASH